MSPYSKGKQQSLLPYLTLWKKNINYDSHFFVYICALRHDRICHAGTEILFSHLITFFVPFISPSGDDGWRNDWGGKKKERADVHEI